LMSSVSCPAAAVAPAKFIKSVVFAPPPLILSAEYSLG